MTKFSWFSKRPGNEHEADWRWCRRCRSKKSIAGFFKDERIDDKRRYVCWLCVEHEVPLTELLMVLVP